MRLRRLWWLALAVAGRLEGQAAPGFHDSVTVVPGAHYAKGSLYRFLLGPHYRDLWATPIRVPVVDQEFIGIYNVLLLIDGSVPVELVVKNVDG